MKRVILYALALMLISPAVTAGSIDTEKLNMKKRTSLGLYLTAAEAYDILKSEGDQILFIDVRTQPEIEFVGYTDSIDANIPYTINDLTVFDVKKSRFKKEANSDFLPQIEKRLKQKGLTKDARIFLMCRSGSRSAKGTELLARAGYKNVYSIVDGFEGDKSKTGDNKGKRTVNGWKNAGLPWTYKLNQNKMYFD